MKVYQTNEIKNIALLGNDGSGKTTLTEALLYESRVDKTVVAESRRKTQ